MLVERLSQWEAMGRLSLSVKTLGGRIIAKRKGTLAKAGKTQKPHTDQECREPIILWRQC